MLLRAGVVLLRAGVVLLRAAWLCCARA